MKKVIENYKKLIFVYVLINCFALLVNLFHIEVATSTSSTYNYYFTYQSTYPNYGTIWPFVDFTGKYQVGCCTEMSIFRGIFYQYDWGEFILYIGLLTAFLVYKAYIVTPKVKVPSV